MIPNKYENTIVQKYFKYHKLLDGDYIDWNKNGFSIAYYELQDNTVLSSLLGYKMINDDNINEFEYINYDYFKYEITKINESVCLICGNKLNIINDDKIECDKCLVSDFRIPIGFSWSIPNYSGIFISKSISELNLDFENEYFKVNIQLTLNIYKHKSCSREWINNNNIYSKKIKSIILKKMIYKPKIKINNVFIYINNQTEVVFPENVNKSHLPILGWKQLDIKY